MVLLQWLCANFFDITGYDVQIITMAENPISKAVESVKEAAEVGHRKTWHLKLLG